MDINDLGKISVTALFSKLISRNTTDNGSGGVFAGLLGNISSAEPFQGVARDSSLIKTDVAIDAKRVNDVKANKIDNNKVANVEKKDDVADKKVKSEVVDDSKSEVPSETKKECVVGDEDNREVKDVKDSNAEIPQVAAPIVEPVLVQSASVNVALSKDNLLVNDEGGEIAFADEVFVDGNTVEFAADTVNTSFEGEVQRDVSDVVMGKETIDTLSNVLSVQNTAPMVEAVDNELFIADAENIVLLDSGVREISADNIILSQEDSTVNTMPQSGDLFKKDGVLLPNNTEQPDLKNNMAVNIADTVEVEDDFSIPAIKSAGHQIKNGSSGQGDELFADVIADDVSVQANLLDEMLGGQKLSVEVNVRVENFSYQGGKSLIKDRISLDEVVNAVDMQSGDDAQVSSPSTDTTSVLTPKHPANVAIQPQAVASIAQTASVLDDTVSLATNSAIAEVGATTSVATAHVASSTEYAGAVKTDLGAKANDTSFRDVFKGMSKEVVEQVKVNITKSAVKGIDTIDVHLKPEELGRIEVKMQIKDGKLHAQIISSRPETMEALQKEAQVLEKAFNEAGFQTDENSLSFSCQNYNRQAGHGQEQNNPLREFIGEVFENEANDEALSMEAANQNWSTENGVNIKV